MSVWLTPQEYEAQVAKVHLRRLEREREFAESVPIFVPLADAPEQFKPGTRRIAPVPRGQGPCKSWSPR